MKRVNVLIALLNLVCITAFAQKDSAKVIKQIPDSSVIKAFMQSHRSESNPPASPTREYIDGERVIDTVKHGPLSHLNLFVNVGVGLPLGKYSNSYFDYVSSNGLSGTPGFKGEGGFAMPGLSFNVLAEMPWKGSKWGLAGQIGYSLNKFNMNDYAYGYSYNNTAFYNSFSIMPGVFAEFKENNVALEFRALLGVLICASPELTYSGDSIITNFQQSSLDTVSITRDVKSTVAVAFAFNLGMSLMFRLSARVELGVNLDYLQAYPTFNPNQVFTQNGTSSFSATSAYCPISLLNAGIRVGYAF
ncbi:MAG TPA: hypothetical protein VNZ45_18770 [Bacteroidia bacterium]|jgi:hypothetical protein|nr:hypothetical protein [Bacteroidia bacterium]